MTKRAGRSADNDEVLAGVMNAGTAAVCLVGKTHDFHVTAALGITLEENVENIRASVAHIVSQKREELFDAEHFFDGYKANPDYALACARTAFEAGARWVILCDTNGGTLPHEVEEIVATVTQHVPGANLGIHAHNDTEQAVANSFAAVRAGARQIQGTLNGIGERCGNANLISIIPTLLLKPAYADRFEIDFYGYRDRPYGEAITGYLREVGIKANMKWLKYSALRDKTQADQVALVMNTWGSYGVNDISNITGQHFRFEYNDFARDQQVTDWHTQLPEEFK